MNFKTSFCTLKNLSVGLFILVWAAVPQESWAGSFSSIRSITSNNIYQCSTGLSWESVGGSSNIHATDGGFSMGCLNNDGTARWIVKSVYLCEGRFSFCEFGNSYMNPPYNAITGTYTRNLPTAVAGVDCQLKKSSRSSYEWMCQKLTSYKDLTVKTVGNEEGLYEGTFLRRYGSFPKIQYPIIANSIMQAEILKNRRYCQGSARFCK